jgi:Chaperone of endosialidase
MAAINKNFVVKNGIEVGDNLIFGNKDQLRVGIGTTVPNYTLDVRGGIGATNVSVGQTLTANIGIVTTIQTSNLTVGGGLNFNSGIGSVLNISGVGTVGSLSIGTTEVISSGRQLKNIISLDAATTATIEAAIQASPNTFDDLNVIGIATFGSNIGVAGIITASSLGISGLTTTQNLKVSGISTFVGFSTFNGDIRVAGIATAQDFDSLSDFRYKTNISTVGNALSKIEQLRGVSFTWKESGLSSYGVVAQELEKVLPELVHGDDPKTVNYNGIIGVLIEAIKELKAEIEELKNAK